MKINSIYVGAFNLICDALGKFYKYIEQSESDGCINVELAKGVKIVCSNDSPMVAITYKRHTVHVPRCNYDTIEIW